MHTDMKTEHLPESYTLQLVKEGNHLAFMQIYNKYQQPIFRFIQRYSIHAAETEDLVHDIFVKLWLHRARINTDLPLKNYLYRIARNTVFDTLNKQVKNNSVQEHLQQHQNSVHLDSPELLYQQREYAALLASAVESLPPQRQKVFQLCRQQGKTYQEAAEKLNISPHTVKEHMSLAMKYIKEYMVKHGDLVFVLWLSLNWS